MGFTQESGIDFDFVQKIEIQFFKYKTNCEGGGGGGVKYE